MATVSDIIKMISTLTDEEKDELRLALANGQPIPSSINELATDSRFAHSCDLDLVQVKNGRGKKGIYDLQHINSYHGKLKKFMAKFNGVSTKHLNNYLAWSGFVNYAKETYDEKRNELLSIILTVPMRSVCKEISSRSALPA